MSSAREKALTRLREFLAEAETADSKWSETGRSTEWKSGVEVALKRLFGEDSDHLKSFRKVSYTPLIFSTATPDRVFDEAFASGLIEARAIIRSAIKEFEDYERETTPGGEIRRTEVPSKRSSKVFVVHGHDNEMKEAVARFLERLRFQPVILHEQASSGDTIIEKIERHSDVSFAIVLLSPDDLGAAKGEPKKLQPRARQNVILELGYFIGRLSRKNVCAIVRGNLELPSDFGGIVYSSFEGDAWKLNIVAELKALDYEVDANLAF